MTTTHIPTILVTGGAGYIGSHTMVELLASGYDVICVDNFSNSSPEAVKRVEKIAGRKVTLVNGDVRDRLVLSRVFQRPVDGVIHFAALKAVGESVERPVDYYDNNIGSALALLDAMDTKGVHRFIFSSSATVYGAPDSLPLTEHAPIRPANPYGQTKAMVEQILRDWCNADARHTAVALRYFNPIGAHESGTIGEDPQDIPNNLFPFITQVAVGKREHLNVWGNDWPTRDGTGVRDYLHVTDLARGHVAALEYARNEIRLRRDQPRHRPRHERAGDGEGVRARVREADSLCARAAPRRRHRRVLRGCLAGEEAARLAGGTVDRAGVRRRVALAAAESGRVSALR